MHPSPQLRQGASFTSSVGENGGRTASTSSTVRQTNHPISLRVVRLSQPSFVPTPVNFTYTKPVDKNPDSQETKCAQALDIVSDAAFFSSLEDASICERGNLLPYTPFVSLPTTFGNIYIGEKFSSYLCVCNDSDLVVHNVGIRAELLTNTQKFVLADTITSSSGHDARLETLGPQQSAEFLIEHEVKELGVHVLECNIQYTLENNDHAVPSPQSSMRKLYKFQVLNPLAVKIKVNTTPENDVFLEAQIKNVASMSMFIERLHFEVNDVFTSEDLNIFLLSDEEEEGQKSTSEEGQDEVGKLVTMITSGCSLELEGDAGPARRESVFGDKFHFNTQDARQYLFVLRPRRDDVWKDVESLAATALGKLDIIWRSRMGQTGRLQTSQLTRKAPRALDAFDVSVVSLPRRVLVEMPFECVLRLRNNQRSGTQRLVVAGMRSQMGTIMLFDKGEYDAGDVAPGQAVDVAVTLFPLLRGLHRVSGLRVTDTRGSAGSSSAVRSVDGIAEVFVE